MCKEGEEEAVVMVVGFGLSKPIVPSGATLLARKPASREGLVVGGS